MVIQVVAVFLASIAMSLAMAHALELPGKLRLSKENYIATQTIYYPGFTIGGIGEGVSMVAALTLLLLTPTTNPAFWWTFVGLVCLVAMHAGRNARCLLDLNPPRQPVLDERYESQRRQRWFFCAGAVATF
jgi:hypothetical protein